MTTVFPDGSPDPGKSGEGGDNGSNFSHITNADFLAGVITSIPEGAFAAVCSKPGNPEIGGWGRSVPVAPQRSVLPTTTISSAVRRSTRSTMGHSGRARHSSRPAIS